MQWQEIREHYPRQWLLLEALEAHSEHEKRILDRLAVLGTYSDSPTALKVYAQVHREAPNKEYYVFHTSRENLNVGERH